MKKALVFTVLVLISFSSTAKSFLRGEAGGHEADMYSVLPFKQNEILSNWLETIQETIDYPHNRYFDGLRKPPHQKFSWGRYGHRLFFHWGFNGKPWSPQIEEMVLACHWDVPTVDLFRKKLIDEQARRNRLVMESTSETLHLGMSGVLREYTNGFASLVYDTHLLGDYSTTKIEPLEHLNLVIEDIKVALYRKLKGGNAALAINKRLDLTKSLYTNPKIRAEKVLEILQEDVPEMILNAQDGYFRKHFKDNRIKIRNGL
jgi:hypothetical protein